VTPKNPAESKQLKLANTVSSGFNIVDKRTPEQKGQDKRFRMYVRERMEDTVLKMVDLFMDMDDNARNMI
jgi:hypothetical protein